MSIRRRIRRLAPDITPPVPTIGIAYRGIGGCIANTADFEPGSSTGGLAEAITSLKGRDGIVYVSCCEHPIPANYAVPTNVHLWFDKGALLVVANGVTLTINGTIEAGAYQIFSLVGTGTVQFGSSPNAPISPEWWGATATGGLQEAIGALP